MSQSGDSRRVVAVCDGSLLTSGVVSMLRERSGLDLLEVPRRHRDRYRRIRDAHPQVVIVGVGTPGERSGIDVRRVLRENPRCSVIVLNLDQPEMEVLRSRRVSGATVGDLLEVLAATRGHGPGGSADDTALSPEAGESKGRRGP